MGLADHSGRVPESPSTEWQKPFSRVPDLGKGVGVWALGLRRGAATLRVRGSGPAAPPRLPARCARQPQCQRCARDGPRPRECSAQHAPLRMLVMNQDRVCALQRENTRSQLFPRERGREACGYKRAPRSSDRRANAWRGRTTVSGDLTKPPSAEG